MKMKLYVALLLGSLAGPMAVGSALSSPEQGATQEASAAGSATGEAKYLERAKNLVEQWPDAFYQVTERGRFFGEYRQRNVLTKKGEKDQLTMIDTLAMAHGGRRLTMEFKTVCKPDATFSPVRIYGSGVTGDAETMDLNVDFHKKRFIASRGSQPPVTQNIDGTVLTLFSLLRAGTFLPLKKGSKLDFTSFETMELRVRKDQTIECVDQDTLKVKDESVPTWKFEHKSEGEVVGTYWFAADGGQLIKAELDGGRTFKLTRGPKKADEEEEKKDAADK